MKTVTTRIDIFFIAVCLTACATTARKYTDTLPGDAQFYSYGVVQSKENFENVKRAHSDYTLYSTERAWIDIKPRRSPSEFNMLQIYYPLHVRWELKDGRQFILENIDVGAIMREYFKSN